MHDSFKYAFGSIACFAMVVMIIAGVITFDPLAELFVTVITVLLGSVLGIAAIDSSKK